MMIPYTTPDKIYMDNEILSHWWILYEVKSSTNPKLILKKNLNGR